MTDVEASEVWGLGFTVSGVEVIDDTDDHDDDDDDDDDYTPDSYTS